MKIIEIEQTPSAVKEFDALINKHLDKRYKVVYEDLDLENNYGNATVRFSKTSGFFANHHDIAELGFKGMYTSVDMLSGEIIQNYQELQNLLRDLERITRIEIQVRQCVKNEYYWSKITY